MKIQISKYPGLKCRRCWKYFPIEEVTPEDHPIAPSTCYRCFELIMELYETGKIIIKENEYYLTHKEVKRKIWKGETYDTESWKQGSDRFGL